MLSVNVDLTPVTSYLLALEQPEQIPFAVAKSLNDLARKIQAEIRTRMTASFTLRKRQWMLNRIYINKTDRATKTSWSVTIQVQEPYNILSKFEAGGERVAVNGRKFLAIPNPATFGRGSIPDELRIKNLHLKTIGNETKGDNETFMIDSKRTGVPLILQDVWNQKGKKKRGMNKGTLNRILYTLVSRVKVPAKLNFVTTAQQVIDAEAMGIFKANIEFALRTAK